jgi:hypothetical protein
MGKNKPHISIPLQNIRTDIKNGRSFFKKIL